MFRRIAAVKSEYFLCVCVMNYSAVRSLSLKCQNVTLTNRERNSLRRSVESASGSLTSRVPQPEQEKAFEAQGTGEHARAKANSIANGRSCNSLFLL